jgi:hypothetical protein
MKKFIENIGKNDIRNVLAVIIVVGCLILLYLLQIKAIPVENKDVLNVALGFVFGGLLSNVGGYYFGSSKNESDSKKNE